MWTQILVWVVTTVIGALLSPRPPKPASVSPGNVDVPVAEQIKILAEIERSGRLHGQLVIE